MKNLFYLMMIMMSMLSCNNPDSYDNSVVVPEPAEINFQPGHFNLTQNTEITATNNDPEIRKPVDLFISDLENLTGLKLEYKEKNTGKGIIIYLDKSLEMTEEAYILSITPRKIRINASSVSGIHYAFQSLKQMIMIYNNGERKIQLPSAMINDKPRFTWRGMHLDVSRHFIPLDDIKKYLDYMSLYKFNKFHWHLTDDQGWRLEILAYPELTNTGAWRNETMAGHWSDQPRKYDGTRHGGFYSREEVRELIQYAADRQIEVIPEIELPGHARAAIASYPYLGVTGEKIDVMKEWGISPYIFKPAEETFIFLEGVLSEVADLFPSGYIHIGGDEAIKDQWKESNEVQSLIKKLGLKDEHELQSWFIQRIEKFLNSKGKKIIGWDEILEGGLAPNATVMSWRGEEGGIAAAQMGHDVIMTPTAYCYFDYYQVQETENEPLAIGGFLPLEKVYSYNPVPASLTEEQAKHILGVQANVWTEYIPDFSQVEYMIFPRMLAMAENGWTELQNKNQDSFMKRVKTHEEIFRIMGVNYSKSGMPE